MSEHLKAAIDFAQNAADDFDNARPMKGIENIQLSLAAAAIAQVEATEWQAQTQVRIALAEERQALAAERQAEAMERIATTLDRMSCEETVNGDLAFSVRLWGER